MLNYKFGLCCVAALLVWSSWAECKQFGRCELARELKRLGFPVSKLRDWVCLVEGESCRRTDAINKHNEDGSRDYGLFQINNRYWCANGRPGGGCHVACEDLLTSDIGAAARCAKIVFRETAKSGRSGFSAWVAWNLHCQGELPDLSDCGVY